MSAVVAVVVFGVYAVAPRPPLDVPKVDQAERCADLNGAPLDARACAAYLAEVDVVAAWCGGIVDGSEWGACADDVLAAHRDPSGCGVTVEVEDGIPTYLAASCHTPEQVAEQADRIRGARPSSRFAP